MSDVSKNLLDVATSTQCRLETRKHSIVVFAFFFRSASRDTTLLSLFLVATSSTRILFVSHSPKSDEAYNAAGIQREHTPFSRGEGFGDKTKSVVSPRDCHL
jgi:hypothetical protein